MDDKNLKTRKIKFQDYEEFDYSLSDVESYKCIWL